MIASTNSIYPSVITTHPHLIFVNMIAAEFCVNNKKTMQRIVFSILILVLFSQCRPARMGLSEEGWQTREEFKVAGKRGLFTRERMSFGEFYTTAVKRSWVKGANSKFGLGSSNPSGYDYTNIISLEKIRRNQTIRFSLSDANRQESEVYCVSNFRASDWQLGNNPNSIFNIGIDILEAMKNRPESKYYVQLYLKANDRPWELMIDNVESQLHPKDYIGLLSKGSDRYYSIVPVQTMEGKDGKPMKILLGTVGFEFRNAEDKAVAAVFLIDKGVVYFQSVDKEERFLLANACAALLMQEELE